VVSLYEENNSLRERLVWLDKAKDLSSASLQLHKRIDKVREREGGEGRRRRE
jgi:hypothetical protein